MEKRLIAIVGSVFGGISGFTLARSQTYDFYLGYGLAFFFALLSILFFITTLRHEKGKEQDNK